MQKIAGDQRAKQSRVCAGRLDVRHRAPLFSLSLLSPPPPLFWFILSTMVRGVSLFDWVAFLPAF